jgi:hypothetical protein
MPRVRLLEDARDFYPYPPYHTDRLCGPVQSVPRVKRRKREADHSPPFIAEVKNIGAHS